LLRIAFGANKMHVLHWNKASGARTSSHVSNAAHKNPSWASKH